MTVDLSITSTSEMGKDHLPTVYVVDCQFRVRDVDIDFRGRARSVVEWISHLIFHLKILQNGIETSI
jgi:hypothetical protein